MRFQNFIRKFPSKKYANKTYYGPIQQIRFRAEPFKNNLSIFSFFFKTLFYLITLIKNFFLSNKIFSQRLQVYFEICLYVIFVILLFANIPSIHEGLKHNEQQHIIKYRNRLI